MKTKTLFLICLLLGIGLPRLFAQNSNSHGTYTEVWERNVNWFAPVYCEGVEVDRIVNSSVHAFVIQHFKDGVSQFTHYNISGEGESTKTDETFTFNEHVIYTTQPPFMCHTHLKGNKGTVYNISILLNQDNTWEVKNATCAGNKK
jgi:hypothetical protein